MTNSRIPGTALVTQTENKVTRNLAGRDAIEVAGDYHYHEASQTTESKLGQLYRRLKEEARGDEELTEYIEQLAIFTREVKQEQVTGLREKLTAANRLDQIDMALAMKEHIYSTIRQNIFSRTLQTIYAILMAKIWEEFTTHVRPAIARGAAREEVDALINARVISPIAAELDSCPDYTGVSNVDIRAMLYFLTGNCHLVWH